MPEQPVLLFHLDKLKEDSIVWAGELFKLVAQRRTKHRYIIEQETVDLLNAIDRASMPSEDIDRLWLMRRLLLSALHCTPGELKKYVQISEHIVGRRLTSQEIKSVIRKYLWAVD